MITPKQKDSILNEVLSEYEGGTLRISTESIAEKHGLKPHVVAMYFEQLNRTGMLEFRELTRDCGMLTVNMEAYDFNKHGGFVAQEELLEASIKKLLLEIESLKPSMPDRVAVITGIASNIATALSLFAR